VFHGGADFRTVAIDDPNLLAFLKRTARHHFEQNALLSGRIIQHLGADCFGLPEIRQQREFFIYFWSFHGEARSTCDIKLIAARAPGERVRVGKRILSGTWGGIPYQIEDGVNGFPVSSVEEAAERMVEIHLKYPGAPWPSTRRRFSRR